jgi:hypothetical protein
VRAQRSDFLDHHFGAGGTTGGADRKVKRARAMQGLEADSPHEAKASAHGGGGDVDARRIAVEHALPRGSAIHHGLDCRGGVEGARNGYAHRRRATNAAPGRKIDVNVDAARALVDVGARGFEERSVRTTEVRAVFGANDYAPAGDMKRMLRRPAGNGARDHAALETNRERGHPVHDGMLAEKDDLPARPTAALFA